MSRIKPKAFWDGQIEAYHKSGMSRKEYCVTKGITPRSLEYHLNKRKKLSEPEKLQNIERKNEWLPMRIIDEPANKCSGGIRLHINRIIIEAEKGFDGNHLANLLRTVGAVC